MGVTVRETPRRLYTARAELVLAQEDVWPLREAPLDPDPLTPFAYAFGELRDDLGDAAEVHLDLVPVTRGAVARRRRQQVHAISEAGSAESRSGWSRLLFGSQATNGPGLVDQLLVGMGHGHAHGHGRGTGTAPRTRRVEGVARLDERDREQTLAKALRDSSPHFEMQLLVRCRSRIKGRPQMLIQSVIACFEEFGGENYLRVRGRRILGRHRGSDGMLRRGAFDRRVDRGIFGPAKAQLVSARQVGGLIKPPTAHCPATNVIRTGGVVPPPPRNLPAFSGSPQQMPWGVVTYDDSERTVAVNLAETYFTWTGGRSRYGKTETSLCRFVHVARAGEGALFLDPHADALARVKPYLADQADRVIELSIARGSGAGRQVGWNPFSMEGCTREDIEDKSSAIVDSFAAAMGWVSDRAPRALTLTQATTHSLLELAVQLPAEIAPTIFQMTTLLSNEEWRAAVVPKLSPSLQAFWLDRFPRLGDEAITPVTNVIDRMRNSPSIAALLGSSRSTYDLREAMDDGKIVLIRLRGTGTIDQLMASFVVYDLLRAVLSRWDTGPQDRRPLHAFMDEVQSYDNSVKGLLASALEEGGKYGLRLHLMNQQPARLSSQTLNAVLTNRSHLMSTNLGYESARLLAKEWQGLVTPETIQDLDKYQFISQVTWRGETTTPFRARGLSLEELFGPAPNGPEIAALEEAIDENSGRRPIQHTLEALAHLDERIADHVTSVVRIDRPPRTDGGPYRSSSVRHYGHSGGLGED